LVHDKKIILELENLTCRLILLCQIRRKTIITARKRVSSAMDGEIRTLPMALDSLTRSNGSGNPCRNNDLRSCETWNLTKYK